MGVVQHDHGQPGAGRAAQQPFHFTGGHRRGERIRTDLGVQVRQVADRNQIRRAAEQRYSQVGGRVQHGQLGQQMPQQRSGRSGDAEHPDRAQRHRDRNLVHLWWVRPGHPNRPVTHPDGQPAEVRIGRAALPEPDAGRAGPVQQAGRVGVAVPGVEPVRRGGRRGHLLVLDRRDPVLGHFAAMTAPPLAPVGQRGGQHDDRPQGGQQQERPQAGDGGDDPAGGRRDQCGQQRQRPPDPLRGRSAGISRVLAAPGVG